MSWFREEIILLVPPFSLARLVSVGSISDSMDGDGIKQLLVELRAECCVTATLDGNHWLEGFQRLDRAL